MEDKATHKGVFRFRFFDKAGKFLREKVVRNVIVNGGLTRHSNILAGFESTDIELLKIEFGTSATIPGDRTLTALVTPIETKLNYTSAAVGGSFPFEVVKTVTIPGETFTRPVTIYEMGSFFGDDVMWNRAVEAAGILFDTAEVVVIDYGVYLT